jgi:hypothetical protein
MGKLDNYLKTVAAIGWTLLIIVFLTVTLVSIGSIFFYRHRGVQGRVKVEMSEEDRVKSKVVTFASPIITKYSDYIMVPIGQRLISGEALRGGFLKGGSYSISGSRSQYEAGYYKYSLHGGDYNNILFYKKDRSESHLLLDKKAAVTEFYYPYESKPEQNKDKYTFLLFGIAEQDYNADGFLTEDDAVVAYISDLSGRHLKAITPPETQLLRWNFDEERGSVYIAYRQDSNKDRKFNILDQAYLVEVDTNTGKIKSFLIDDNVIHKVKSVVF